MVRYLTSLKWPYSLLCYNAPSFVLLQTYNIKPGQTSVGHNFYGAMAIGGKIVATIYPKTNRNVSITAVKALTCAKPPEVGKFQNNAFFKAHHPQFKQYAVLLYLSGPLS